MSAVAKVCGWVAGIVLAGVWAWHHGRYDAQVLGVIVVALLVAGALLVRDIDQSRYDRLADPRPFPHERGRQ